MESSNSNAVTIYSPYSTTKQKSCDQEALKGSYISSTHRLASRTKYSEIRTHPYPVRGGARTPQGKSVNDVRV